MDRMNRDLAMRLLAAFFLGGGFVGLCFEFQKLCQQVPAAGIVLGSITYCLIALFFIVGPERLRRNRAVRALQVALLWGVFWILSLLSHGDRLAVWITSIVCTLYGCLAVSEFLEQRRETKAHNAEGS
jgi:hydrogenase-4 membrane subunit HyfE